MFAMEMRGFVFTDDFKNASYKMQRTKRAPTLWERVAHQADQLCTALSQPEQITLAGIYNHIVTECQLPVNAVRESVKKAIARAGGQLCNGPLLPHRT